MIDFASLPSTTPADLAVLILATCLAGLARGFAGFGGGLIVMPAASALIGPQVAVAVFVLADIVFAAPLLPNAFRRADWPTVLPAGLAAMACVPIGIWALITADPETVRWSISLLTLAMLGLLLSGWRYRGRPKLPATIGVGGFAGILGGLAQMPGPPIVTYWMSGPATPAVARANLISFFAFTSLVSFAGYLWGGLFTLPVLTLTLIVAPVYGASIWVGARLHGHAPEQVFRLVVYGLIGLSALTALPVLDPVFGRA